MNCWPPPSQSARIPRALLATLAFSLALPLACPRPARAQEPPIPDFVHTAPAPEPPTPAFPQPAPAPPAVTVLDLNQCLHLALDRQPRLAAARASLAAAQDGLQALENLRLAAVVDREIPVRRRQAALGVTAAAAGVDVAEHDAAYAVARSYFTILFAREQEEVARSVVDRLTAIQQTAKRQLDAGARDVSSADVNRATVYLRLARAKRVEAAGGVIRARAALKEAVGLGDVCLDVPPGRLPEPAVSPCLGDIVALALARRGDLVRATVFAEVACLEIDAQGTSIHPKMNTFAIGSDIHAVQVPQGVANTEYRPGAVPPEMPALLAGPRADRVKRAQDLHFRARAVVETARNLITLEAEDAVLRWQQAAQQVAEAREAAATGTTLAEDLTKDFTAGLKVKVDEVVNARVLAAQARSQLNEYLYREILALLDLERITAGGVCANLVEAAAQPEAARKDNGGTK